MNTISSMGDTAAFNAIVNRTITAFEDDQITTVGDYAFRGCSSLTKISLPAATSIGDYAFYACTSLYDVSLPAVTSLGDYAFYGCNSSQFTSLVLPSVETIGYNAFYSCNKLVTIDLPSVTRMDDNVFSSCSSLTTIIIRNTNGVVPIGNNLLSGANSAIIYVPDALVNDYKTASNWASYFNRIKGLSELPNS